VDSFKREPDVINVYKLDNASGGYGVGVQRLVIWILTKALDDVPKRHGAWAIYIAAVLAGQLHS
jgi:hypothetical protein